MTEELSPLDAAILTAVRSGATVVANYRRHEALIAAARSEGLLVRIDRRSRWANPFRLGADGDREAVIERYRIHLRRRPDLVARLPDLRGRLLACWCAPEPCHGDVLRAAVERLAR